MSRRSIQVFNMSFLDMMTNFLGAVIILFLLAAKEMGKKPFPNVKGTAKVTYNEKTKNIEGVLDATVLSQANIKEGDTILVIVGKKTNEAPKKEIASNDNPYKYQEPPKEQGTILRPDQTVVSQQELDELRKNPPADNKCRIFPTIVKVSACDDHGTSSPDDDSYTAEVKVSSVGKCTNLWKDDKSSAIMGYEKSKIYTFLVKNGQQSIKISDNIDPDISQTVSIPMPAPCAKAEDKKFVKQVFPPPPGINFQIEFDAKLGNVDLWVEKDGRWVFGGHKKEDWGRWDDDRKGFLNPGKTGLERVRQLDGPIPGTYKIYAHYREKGTQPSIKLSLYVSSQKVNQSDKFDFVVPKTENNPRNHGGMLLKTIVVGKDGFLKY